MIKALKEKPRYLKMKELVGIYPIESKFLTVEFRKAFGRNFVAVAVPKATARNSVSVNIPSSFTKVFKGRARVLTEFRPDGIYPLPIDMVLKEVRGALTKDHTIVAMPREAIGR